MAARLGAVPRLPDFGRDSAAPAPPLRWKEVAALAALLLAFLLLSFLADLRPGRKFYFEAQLVQMRPFFDLDRLSPAERYYSGNAIGSFCSLPYMLALKAAHALVPSRLLSLRLVSLAATFLSLILMFGLARRLFCPAVALLWVFSLVFSPLWLDGMRAFGYLPFTHLFVVAGCVALTLPGGGRRPWLKAGALALSLYATLSLYLPSHLIFWLGLAYLALDLRREWKVLALSLLLFFGGTLLIDALIGDVALDFRDFLLPEIGGEWIMRGVRMDGGLLHGNLLRNAPLLLRPLVSSSALPLPALFAAFCGTGVVLSLLLRRRSHVFALLWLGVFLLSPLTSNAIPLRRIIFAFAPLHLAGALGAYLLFRLAAEALGQSLSRRLLVPAALVLLVLSALFSSRRFLREVSRPAGEPSREELRRLAGFLLAREEEDVLVMYDEKIAERIWGNPDFADRVSEDLNRRMTTVTPLLARRFHRAALERRPRPSLVLYPRAAEEGYRGLASWGGSITGGKPEGGTVEGTGVDFIVLPAPAGLPPELLSTASPRFSASSRGRAESAWVGLPDLRNNLTDGDSTSAWMPEPGKGEEPPWVQIDFGPGVEKEVAVVGLQPSGDHPSAEGFIHRGELLRSPDGRFWEKAAVLEDGVSDPRPRWRYWIVEDPRPARFYRLVVRDPLPGGPGGFRGIGDIVIYESEDAWVLRRPEGDPIVYRPAPD